MEDNEEYEVSRLKKLLEDRIIQAEKENMAILQGSTKSQKDLVQPAKRNVKSCPHLKSPPASESHSPQEWSGVSTRDIHSHIHFLKDLESSLLSTFDNRKHLIDDAKNRYFPCAVPLSPPVRLKKDVSEVQAHTSSKNQSYISEQQISETMHNKPHKDFTMIEKYFPSMCVYDNKQSTSTSSERKELLEDKNTYQGTPFVHKMKTSPSNRSPRSSFPANKKLNFSSTEEDNPKPELVETLAQAVDENKHGLQLQISLDSCSTKDVISKILHRIPEFTNKIEVSSNDLIENSHTSPVQGKKEDKISQTYETERFNSTHKFNKNPVKQKQTMSSSVQTDKTEDELRIDKQELHHLVKEIVLETLQNMQFQDHIHRRQKSAFTYPKVDSGIQSEIENDIGDCSRNFKMGFPDKDLLLDQENGILQRKNYSSSKSVQVDLHPDQTIKSPDVHDKSCNTDYPIYFHKIDEGNHIAVSSKEPENGDSVFERNSSPAQDPSKIELMLEKIYDHICEEKEASRTFNNNSPNYPILTRDVAVQFNPLHTSTKSTLTSEIKKADSSCQYDILLKVTPDQTSKVDASVQYVNIIEPRNDHLLQINAYTQYEPKNFLDSVAQTELLLNSEHSATNTSVSSTPVSDNMFMDDLLSEGEVSLPWNLRLLSLSGGGLSMNNADSSEASIKEKDYSLSEGEIHPNVVRYLNMCHSSTSDEYDLQQDLYPTKLVSDSKIQYAASSNAERPSGQSTVHSRNLHVNISNSSYSEGEIHSNMSLSAGEVSPSFRFLESPPKSENRPSSRSSNYECNPHYSSLTAASFSQACDLSGQSVASNFTESGLQYKGNMHEETNLQNSQTVLQTVDEEEPSTSN